MSIELKAKILTGGLPLYKKHEGDAGTDLSTPQRFILGPGESTVIDFKVAVKIPEGHVGLLINRSSIGINKGCVGNLGVIDSEYIGSLKFKLFNLSEWEPQSFEVGDRIAQLVVVPCFLGGVEYVDDLGTTSRGENGIGSTGK